VLHATPGSLGVALHRSPLASIAGIIVGWVATRLRPIAAHGIIPWRGD
jgi:hypothetical protein